RERRPAVRARSTSADARDVDPDGRGPIPPLLDLPSCRARRLVGLAGPGRGVRLLPRILARARPGPPAASPLPGLHPVAAAPGRIEGGGVLVQRAEGLFD